jgi:hypothetical protein
MAAMPRAPFVVSAVIVAGVLALAVQLAVDSEPFAPGPAALLAVGMAALALVAMVGLLLSRGRWSLWLAYTVSAAVLALATVVSAGRWLVAAVVLTLAGVTGLAGPWLRGWLRQRPAATGPGARPVLLLLGALALLPGASVASPSGLSGWHIALVVVAAASAWAYSAAFAAGLWTLRSAVPALSVAAAFASPPAGTAYLAAHGLALGYLAWSGESARPVYPLVDRLYGPRSPRPHQQRAGEGP